MERITVNGKRVAFYSKATTERQAQKDIKEQIIAYEKKKDTGDIFGNLFTEWENEYSETVSFNSFYKSNAKRNRVRSYFENYTIKDISLQDVQKYMDYNQTYAKKTIKCDISLLSVFFHWCITKGYIDSNPCQYAQVKVGKAPNERHLPTDEAIAQIKKHRLDNQFSMYMFFLIYTGMRKSEVLALNAEDIRDGFIYVNKTLVWDGNKAVLQNHPKTEAGERKVPVLSPLKEIIDLLPKKGILFPHDGGYFTNSKYTRGIAAYKKATGIKDIKAHEVRHYYATILFEAGISVYEAQKMIGHKDIQTTQRIYHHIRDARLEINTKKMEEYLKQIQ